MLIDSHCHLHDHRMIKDVDAIVRHAQASGVQYMVSCATSEENFETTLELSRRFKSVLPCFGIHPWFIKSRSVRWKKTLAMYLDATPSGVGETGLDFTDKSWDFEDQMQVFQYHMDLACEMQRPLNIHVRKAWDALIHLLKKRGPLMVPGVIHSYSGSFDMLRIFEKYNLYISFSGSVTLPNANKVLKALAGVHPSRFVLETDAPDIRPYINGRQIPGLNQPALLPEIAQTAAQRIHKDETVLITGAYENATQLFSRIMPGSIGLESV